MIHNLIPSKMYDLYNNKIKSHKKWTKYIEENN